jgi:hypothetical protein
MKKNRMRVMASLIAATALVAGAAGAETVVGWDFSQYHGDGALTPFTDTLPANYSDLDPTHNAGAESATYGTLYFDGSFGSSSTLTAFLPTSGTLNCQRIGNGDKGGGCQTPNNRGPVASNLDEPWSDPGDVSFDAHGLLKAEGQADTNYMAMSANNNVSVVFEANPGAAATTGSGWGVSFGAKVVSGTGDDGGPVSCDAPGVGECTSTITVEFSPDGSTYSSFGSVNLTADDTRFDVPLAAGASGTGYVRLGLAPGAGGALPIIDNVAVTATLPEPGVTMMFVSGVLGLVALERRRRA